MVFSTFLPINCWVNVNKKVNFYGPILLLGRRITESWNNLATQMSIRSERTPVKHHPELLEGRTKPAEREALCKAECFHGGQDLLGNFCGWKRWRLWPLIIPSAFTKPAGLLSGVGPPESCAFLHQLKMYNLTSSYFTVQKKNQTKIIKSFLLYQCLGKLQ